MSSIYKSTREVLKAIKREPVNINKQFEKLVNTVPEWRQKRDLLLSAKGVGNVQAYTLMSELPELGLLYRKEIAALVGCMRKQFTTLNTMVKNNTY